MERSLAHLLLYRFLCFRRTPSATLLDSRRFELVLVGAERAINLHVVLGGADRFGMFFRVIRVAELFGPGPSAAERLGQSTLTAASFGVRFVLAIDAILRERDDLEPRQRDFIAASRAGSIDSCSKPGYCRVDRARGVPARGRTAPHAYRLRTAICATSISSAGGCPPLRACSRINSFTRASVSARSLASRRLSASIRRPPVLTAASILVFCLLRFFVGRVLVRVFIDKGRSRTSIQYFNMSIDRASRHCRQKTSGLNSLAERHSSPVVPNGNCFKLVASPTIAAPGRRQCTGSGGACESLL